MEHGTQIAQMNADWKGCSDNGYRRCAGTRQSHNSELKVGVGLRTTTWDPEAVPFDKLDSAFLWE
jgi:hypothetical protein